MRIAISILALLAMAGCASLWGTDNRSETDLAVSELDNDRVTTKQESDTVHASGSTVDTYGRL